MTRKPCNSGRMVLMSSMHSGCDLHRERAVCDGIHRRAGYGRVVWTDRSTDSRVRGTGNVRAEDILFWVCVRAVRPASATNQVPGACAGHLSPPSLAIPSAVWSAAFCADFIVITPRAVQPWTPDVDARHPNACLRGNVRTASNMCMHMGTAHEWGTALGPWSTQWIGVLRAPPWT